MNNWNQLQGEVAAWADRNFGHTPASYPMLGLVEECAEFMAAREAIPPSIPAMEDALGDQAIYVLNLCEKAGIQFADCTTEGRADHADHELLGALGLASHAVLKYEQRIRGMTTATRAKHLVVALSVWYRWADWQAHGRMLEITSKVWAEVQRRDWVANPNSAHEVVRDDLAAGK